MGVYEVGGGCECELRVCEFSSKCYTRDRDTGVAESHRQGMEVTRIFGEDVGGDVRRRGFKEVENEEVFGECWEEGMKGGSKKRENVKNDDVVVDEKATKF